MTVRVRLSGQPDEIAALIAALADRFEITGGDRAYPNRGAFGVRVYLEARPLPGSPPPGTSERPKTGRGGVN